MAGLMMVLVCLSLLQISEGLLVNVALNKPAHVRYTDASLSVDGDTGTYIHTLSPLHSPAWWTVDLERSVQNATVKLYFRPYDKETRYPLHIHTSTTAFTTYPQGDHCFTNTDDTRDVISTQCSGTWRHLMIYKDKKSPNDTRNYILLYFAEVEVLELGQNVALNKPAHMRYPAWRAVDGYKDTFIFKKYPLHSPAWMTVDLERSVQNATVKLYFKPYHKETRYPLHIHTSTTAFTAYTQGDHCFTNTDDTRDVISTQCSGTWRHLMIYKDKKSPNDTRNYILLYFAEVEVLACSDGSYGINCDKNCSSRHCAVTSASCPSTTGACPPGGCDAGYLGEDCAQECTSETYGAGCSKSCSSRRCAVPSDTCDRFTGTCGTHGCQAWYRGDDCVQKCTNDTYGPSCSKSCSSRHCAVPSDTCDRFTGTCGTHGCQDGYEGDDCVQVPSHLIWIAIGTGIGVTVILVVVGVVIGCLKRKARFNRPTSDQPTPSAQFNMASRADEPTGNGDNDYDSFEVEDHYDQPEEIVQSSMSAMVEVPGQRPPAPNDPDDENDYDSCEIEDNYDQPEDIIHSIMASGADGPPAGKIKDGRHHYDKFQIKDQPSEYEKIGPTCYENL